MLLNILPLVLAICRLGDAVTVECNYQFYNFGILGDSRYPRPFVSGAYRCEGRLSRECDSNKRVVGVSRNHGIPGRSIRDVRYLSFENQFIPQLPYSLPPFFSDIIVLTLIRIQLSDITSRDLKYRRLQFLSMKSNQLKNLRENLFEFNHDLEFLDVSDNPLSTAAPDLFDYLGNMKIVFIYDTPCMGTYLGGIFDVNDGGHRIEDLKRHLREYCTPSMFGSLFSLMEEVGDDKFDGDDLDDYYIQDLRIDDRGRSDCSDFMLLQPGSKTVGAGIVEMAIKDLMNLLD